MKYLYIFTFALLLSGCIPSVQSVDNNAINISKNSDNIKQATTLIEYLHSNEATQKLMNEATLTAEKSFNDSIKNKSAINADTAKTATKTIGSLSEMAGIPYGGIVMDIIGGLAGLFGLKKTREKVSTSIAERKREQENWEKLLMKMNPETAKEIKDYNA